MQQATGQFAKHHRQQRDGELLEDLQKRAVDAEPCEAQAEKNREHAQPGFEEGLRRGFQRRGAREADDAARHDACRVQNRACYGPDSTTPRAGCKAQSEGLAAFLEISGKFIVAFRGRSGQFL